MMKGAVFPTRPEGVSSMSNTSIDELPPQLAAEHSQSVKNTPMLQGAPARHGLLVELCIPPRHLHLAVWNSLPVPEPR